MNKDDIYAVIGILFLYFFGMFVGVMIGLSHVKNEAIENGVAKYVVNEKTGETKFEWKNFPN